MNKYFIATVIFILITACNGGEQKNAPDTGRTELQKVSSDEQATVNPDGSVQEKTPPPMVTFIELGSVNCIPCKKMQPVMKEVERKYGKQIRVIFYDVWKKGQKKYARQYKIMSIPTQVFLDSSGEEISRHIGFYPESEIDEFLRSQGLVPVKADF